MTWNIRPLTVGAVLPIFFIAVCAGLQLWTGGYASDCGQTADEAAHFVTSLMMFDYVSGGLPGNPVAFAKDYYAHFPRVAIGHWPPLFEATLALFFGLFGRSQATAIAFQALATGLSAGLPAALMQRRAGFVEGVLTGAIVLAVPYTAFLADTVMADSFLAVLVFAATYAWSRAYETRSWTWCILFALSSVAAILTKGTGYGLALLPVIHMTMKRDLRFLFAPKVLVAAAIVALLTVPWYVATYKLAAGGFVYKWGWDYSSRAVPAYLVDLAQSLGVVPALLLAAGLVASCSRKFAWPWDVSPYAASALAMIAFAAIVPADITARYLIPAIPVGAVVLVSMLSQVSRALAARFGLSAAAARAAAAAVICVSVAVVFRMPHVEPFHSRQAVATIFDARQPNPLVLISGSVRAEGALIASFAQRDLERHYYAVRGTKVLASGNFMGTEYSARFASAAATLQWLRDNAFGWIVVDDAPQSMKFAHNGLLVAALKSDPAHFHAVRTIEHSGGRLTVYRTSAAAKPADKNAAIFKELSPQLD